MKLPEKSVKFLDDWLKTFATGICSERAFSINMKILVLDAGSSSQKSCLYQLPADSLPQTAPEPIWQASIDWSAVQEQGILNAQANGVKKDIILTPQAGNSGIHHMLRTLVQGETKVMETLQEIAIVGHRVVHGGSKYQQATAITADVKAAIAELIPLAPNHNPAHLEGINAIEQLLGEIPQVAVFDTAFHSTIPDFAATYPIPWQWTEKGIRRYGFHGISHQYCSQRVSQLLNKAPSALKLITCHLGNGCSVTAINHGKSVNTTMGFSPLEGLMMGSRSGSIDPTILLHLMDQYQITAPQLNQMLNKESGLKGVSGVSADMRSLLTQISSGNSQAKLAFDMYIHRLQFHIAAMLPSLNGLDALIFTAGVGENAAIVRQKTCDGFAFLGWQLDSQHNEVASGDRNIAANDSSIPIFVIHTEEDWVIAQECWKMANKNQLCK